MHRRICTLDSLKITPLLILLPFPAEIPHHLFFIRKSYLHQPRIHPHFVLPSPIPMEVFGTVAGVIGLVTAIQEIYTTLEKVRGLPKAFDAAGTQLALVSRVFENAKTKAERAELNQDERKSLEAIAARSRDSLETLLDIFKSLQRKCGSDTDWPRIRGWYIELLKGKKAHRVEALMSEVLKDLELLRVSNDSVLATEEDIADIKRAIEGLSNVEPSVEDSELETVRSMTQNVSDHSTGNQFYQPDMQNSGPVFFGAISGGQHFGQRTNYYGKRGDGDS